MPIVLGENAYFDTQTKTIIHKPKKKKLKLQQQSLEWNVYFFDFNANQIKSFNIFNHSSFYKDILTLMEKYYNDELSDQEFSENVKRELLYYFWGKVEYEIILSPVVPRKEDCSIKESIYDQVMLNFNHFVNYLITQIYN